ncbi:site-specific integrase [Clavibacter zhangzhiyongii]|uniref:site-specific integrase n=1 Tax=Clavibacter zhangzhiyongii TaxID=2768071 RepID=UPI0039E0E2D1
MDDAPQPFLSAPAVKALVSALDDRAPDGLLVRLTALTGSSAGEIQGLQIRDVNLLRKTLSVRRTRVRTMAGWQVGTPKSEKSVRDVPLRRVLVTALRDYLDEHPHKADPKAWLWPGRHHAGGGEWRGALDWSKPLDFDSFYRNRYKPAAVAVLGLPGLRFHDLRHTAASLFAGSRMPLARVARLLGHADTATTYRLYLHFFPDDYAADMDRLDLYLAPEDVAPHAVALSPRSAGHDEGEVFDEATATGELFALSGKPTARTDERDPDGHGSHSTKPGRMDWVTAGYERLTTGAP